MGYRPDEDPHYDSHSSPYETFLHEMILYGRSKTGSYLEDGTFYLPTEKEVDIFIRRGTTTLSYLSGRPREIDELGAEAYSQIGGPDWKRLLALGYTVDGGHPSDRLTVSPYKKGIVIRGLRFNQFYKGTQFHYLTAREFRYIVDLISNWRGDKTSTPRSPSQEHKEPSMSSTILSVKPNVSFEDVIGLEDAKQALREAIILPIHRPDLFNGALEPWKGILLFGPPGCGKTLLAKAIATEAQAKFFPADAASLMSKWVGESEKEFRKLFASARREQPAVIFMDEVDALASERGAGDEGAGDRKFKSQFLSEMDGIKSEKDGRVVVIGATNRPQDLDSAFRRRFEQRIYVPLPNEQARERLFRLHLKGVSYVDVDFQILARRSEGYSGADIKNLCREAYLITIREMEEKLHDKTAKPRPINMTDFERSLETIPSTVSKSELVELEKWNKQFGRRAALVHERLPKFGPPVQAKESKVKPERLKSRIGNSVVYIGSRPLMSYITACVTQLNRSPDELFIKARGRAISRAVDVVEVLRTRFMPDLQVEFIDLRTEKVKTAEGNIANVSAMDVSLIRGKPEKTQRERIIIPQGADNVVYVGSESLVTYITECVEVLNRNPDELIIFAQGNDISRAVDVEEVLRNRWMPNLIISDVAFDTHQVKTQEGKPRNISVIMIRLFSSK